MAEAAEVHRPTLRQQKLAEAVVIHGAKTVTEAARVAGLSRTHASESLRHNPTTQREIERLKRGRGDKARGLHALAEKALNDPSLIDALEPRDRLAFGLQAMKAANELGLEPEPGDRNRFKAWKRRRLARSRSIFIRMHTAGVGPLGWRVPQDVVLSPSHNEL